jgi:hypothetical protein
MLPNVDWWILVKFRKNITHTKGKTVQEDCSWIDLPPKRRWFTNRHDVTSQKTWNTAMRTSDVAVTCSPQAPAVWGRMLRFHNPDNVYWRYWIVSSAVRCKGRRYLAKMVISAAMFSQVSLSSQRSSDHAHIKKKGNPLKICGHLVGRTGLFDGPHEFT